MVRQFFTARLTCRRMRSIEEAADEEAEKAGEEVAAVGWPGPRRSLLASLHDFVRAIDRGLTPGDLHRRLRG